MGFHFVTVDAECHYLMSRALTEARHAAEAVSIETAGLHQQLAGAYLVKVVAQHDIMRRVDFPQRAPSAVTQSQRENTHYSQPG